MERFALAAVILPVLAAAPAQQAIAELSRRDFTMIDAQPNGMAELYADYPSVLRDYVAAMDGYRMLKPDRSPSGFAYPLIARNEALVEGPWAWAATNGSTVRRLQTGGFRLTVGDYLVNWFVEVDCQDIGWPMFSCGDGRQREMSSPNLTTLVFDGVEYKRVLPTGQQPAPAEAAQQAPGTE